MLSNIMEIYYRVTNGYYSENLDLITQATLLHLIDNGYGFKSILDIINKSDIKDCLRPESLPDSLWEDSLIKRNTYYYHNTLHITSKPPKWNPVTMKAECEPFFMEMKINYTMKDLLDYFYNKCKIDVNLRDEKRDGGAFEFLMNKYEKIKNIEALDFVLLLIDEACNSESFITSPLKLQDYDCEVLDNCKKLIAEAKYNQANKIVWRTLNV